MIRTMTRTPRLEVNSYPSVAKVLFLPAAEGGMGFVPPSGAQLSKEPGKRARKQTISVGAGVLADLKRADPRAAPIVDAIICYRSLQKIIRRGPSLRIKCLDVCAVCALTRHARVPCCAARAQQFGNAAGTCASGPDGRLPHPRPHLPGACPSLRARSRCCVQRCAACG